MSKSTVSQGNRVAQSMKMAASMSGFALADIKAAKKAGCSAFRGSRVYLDELDEFFASNPECLTMSPQERLDFKTKQIKHASAQFDYDLKRGDYIHRGELAEHIRATETEAKGILRKFLFNELPAKGEMLSRASLLELCEESFDQICVAKQKAFSKWI